MGNEFSTQVKVEKSVFELPVKLPVISGPLDDGGVYKGESSDSSPANENVNAVDDNDIVLVNPDVNTEMEAEVDRDTVSSRDQVTSQAEEINTDNKNNNNQISELDIKETNAEDLNPINKRNVESCSRGQTVSGADDMNTAAVKTDNDNSGTSFKSRLSFVLSERMKRNSDGSKVLSVVDSYIRDSSPSSSEVDLRNEGMTGTSSLDNSKGKNGNESLPMTSEHFGDSSIYDEETESLADHIPSVVISESVMLETTKQNGHGNGVGIPQLDANDVPKKTNSNAYDSIDKSTEQRTSGDGPANNHTHETENLEDKVLQEVLQKDREKQGKNSGDKQKKKDSFNFKVKFGEITKRYKKSSKKRTNTAPRATTGPSIAVNDKAREIQSEYQYAAKAETNSNLEMDKRMMKDANQTRQGQTIRQPTGSEREGFNLVIDNPVDIAGEYVTLSHLDLATVVELDSENNNSESEILSSIPNRDSIISSGVTREKHLNDKSVHDSETDHILSRCSNDVSTGINDFENLKQKLNSNAAASESDSIPKQNDQSELVTEIDKISISRDNQHSANSNDSINQNMELNTVVVEQSKFETAGNDGSVDATDHSDQHCNSVIPKSSEDCEQSKSQMTAPGRDIVANSTDYLSPVDASSDGTDVSRVQSAKTKPKGKDNRKSSFMKYLLYMEPKKKRKSSEKTRVAPVAHETRVSVTQNSGQPITSSQDEAGTVHVTEKVNIDDTNRTGDISGNSNLPLNTGRDSDELNHEGNVEKTGKRILTSDNNGEADEGFLKTTKNDEPDKQNLQGSKGNGSKENNVREEISNDRLTQQESDKKVSTEEVQSQVRDTGVVPNSQNSTENRQPHQETALHMDSNSKPLEEPVVMRRKVEKQNVQKSNSNQETTQKRKSSFSSRISGFFSQGDLLRMSSGFKFPNKKKDADKPKQSGTKGSNSDSPKKRYSQPDLREADLLSVDVQPQRRSSNVDSKGQFSYWSKMHVKTKSNKPKKTKKKRGSSLTGFGNIEENVQTKEEKRRSLFDDDFHFEEVHNELHDVISLSSLSSTEECSGSSLHIAHVHSSSEQVSSKITESNLIGSEETENSSPNVIRVDDTLTDTSLAKVKSSESEVLENSSSVISGNDLPQNVSGSDFVHSCENLEIKEGNSDPDKVSEIPTTTDNMAGKFLRNSFSGKTNFAMKFIGNGSSEKKKENGVCKERVTCSIEADDMSIQVEEKGEYIMSDNHVTAIPRLNKTSDEISNSSDKRSQSDTEPEEVTKCDSKRLSEASTSCKSKSSSVSSSPKLSRDENGLKSEIPDSNQIINLEELSVQKVSIYDENDKKRSPIYRSVSETEARGVYCTSPVGTHPNVKSLKSKSRSSSFSEFWKRPSKHKVMSWKSKSKSKDNVNMMAGGNVVQSSSTSILYM